MPKFAEILASLAIVERRGEQTSLPTEGPELKQIDQVSIRSHLEREIESFEKSKAAIKQELKLSGEVCVNPHMDSLDCAKDECDLKSRIRIHNHATANIAEHRQAIRRMASGTYGFCAVCGSEIESRRLKARPASELCVICQGYRERNFAPVRNGLSA
jgi:RNA polymerase-binding protein DksA